MNKKVISAILAGACAVSAMSFSVSAATTQKAATAGTDVKLTASVVPVVPVINVTVPSGVSAVLNPYGIAVTDKSGNKYGPDGVTSELYTIINQTTTSNVEVKVTPTVTVPTVADETKPTKGTKPSITVVTKPDQVKNTSQVKQLYAAVAASGSSDSTAIVALDAAKEEDATNATSANADNKGNVLPAKLTALLDTTAETEIGASTTVVFTDATVTKDADGGSVTPTAAQPQRLVVIKAAEEGEFTYAQFQLVGAVNTNLTWTSSDKLSVNVILNIGPSGEDATDITAIS